MTTQTITKTIDILLVEDNPGDVRLFRETLAETGASQYRLTSVSNLAAALKRLDEERYDIIVLDLTLPDSRGIGTLKSVRMHSPRVPVILLTTVDDEAIALTAIQNGAQDYLIKG
ncbi:MAG: response regulator, partial [Nitrospirota bacterium]